MGEFMHDDICEQILRRSDVEDLIRYKSVCKSWKSLISHPRFVKAHHKRQVNLILYRMGIIPNYLSKYGPEYYMVGSSNGLACINSFDGDEFIVANPWTRQERIMIKPKVSYGSCWGFGYDSLTDDYKVVYGKVEGRGKTTFQVLSLKSNVLKHVGHVDYTCWGAVHIGTLCNGALHWVMYPGNPSTERLISFDLAKEVFTEIHQPDDAIRKCSFSAIEERNVCIYDEYSVELLSGSRTRKYIVKRYWENTSHHYHKLRIHSEKPYTFIPTTVMPSLISPHLQEGKE